MLLFNWLLVGGYRYTGTGILSTGRRNWELIKRVQRTTLDTDESRHEGEHMGGLRAAQEELVKSWWRDSDKTQGVLMLER